MNYLEGRKLQHIYDCLIDGSNDQANQAATKLLKKNPGWVLVKALKGIALARSEKPSEANALLKEAKDESPTDDDTLNALTIAYEELGQYSDIGQIYENATKKRPKDRKLMIHWFMAMMQCGTFGEQQKAALSLYRTFNDTKYLLWRIMALALQGKNGNALSYQLAERMIKQAHEEKKLEPTKDGAKLEKVEYLRLYLMILLEQNKFKEALDLMKTPLGQDALHDPEVRQINMEILLENEQWDDAMALSKLALMNENSDDWISWLAYFNAMEKLISSDNMGIFAKDAFVLVNELKASAIHTAVLKRGPFLAEMELNHRLRKMHHVDEKAVLSSIVSYFERFGSKICCFEDLQTYTAFLRDDKDKAMIFVDALRKTVQDTDDKNGKIKNVYKYANIRKIERFLSLHTVSDLTQGIALVNDLWKSYQEALPLGIGLEKTEYQYGDDFALLSSHILVDLYHAHKIPALLIQAVVLLETALTKSIYNFQIKLTLGRIYSMLGVFLRPFEIYKTMDIKQIQFDTMIHYFTDRFSSLGCYSPLEETLIESFDIYERNGQETPKMLVMAYNCGTFSKIPEFMEFRSRLDTSLQHSISKIELARIKVSQAPFKAKNIIQHFRDMSITYYPCNDAFIRARSDNRDFKVFMNSNSEDSKKAVDRITPMTSTNTTWLQMYSLIFNTLACACNNKKATDLDGMVDQFEQFLKGEIQDKVSSLEYWMAKYICELSSALVLAKFPQTNDTKVEEKLQNAIYILKEKMMVQSDDIIYTKLQWLFFHEITIILEMHDYGAALLDLLESSTKGSKQLKASLAILQTTANKIMLSVQKNIHQTRAIYKNHMPQKFLQDIIDSDMLLENFKSKEHRRDLDTYLKSIVVSWSSSLDNLGGKVDKRVK